MMPLLFHYMSRSQRGGGDTDLPILDPTARRGGWSVPRPGCFTPQERDPVPIVYEARSVSRLVWMGPENLAPTRVQNPDCPLIWGGGERKKKKKRDSSPVTGLEWPRGFQEDKVPRFHDNGTGWW
jgi:hypothetical protein